MDCKSCGSTNLDMQGSAIVGSDRTESWAKDFLDDMMYTCLDCKSTFIYKKIYLPGKKWYMEEDTK
uniref:Uncharacterized protein n=1 Tax=viral metagenome TaxID=1070528 RepID=A0A6M3JHN0_9ZZZZ